MSLAAISRPDGLPEGARVKRVSFDHGCDTAEFEGRELAVFIAGRLPITRPDHPQPAMMPPQTPVV